MPTPLTCRTDRTNGTVSLIAVGEIDLSNIEVFNRAMTEATSSTSTESGPLTVDLIGIDYMDSGAISALFAHAEQIRVIANPILLPVLTFCGLPDVVDVRCGPLHGDS